MNRYFQRLTFGAAILFGVLFGVAGMRAQAPPTQAPPLPAAGRSSTGRWPARWRAPGLRDRLEPLPDAGVRSLPSQSDREGPYRRNDSRNDSRANLCIADDRLDADAGAGAQRWPEACHCRIHEWTHAGQFRSGRREEHAEQVSRQSEHVESGSGPGMERLERGCGQYSLSDCGRCGSYRRAGTTIETEVGVWASCRDDFQLTAHGRCRPRVCGQRQWFYLFPGRRDGMRLLVF